MILICPKCEENDITSPLVADRNNAKYAVCPKGLCQYKLSIDLEIVLTEDTPITTISGKGDTP